MKNIIINMSWLLLVQISNFLLPLLSIPYLGRTLGVKDFGLIMFALSLIQFVMIVTDFGFNLSGTKQISLNRNNKDKINEIFCSIISAKCILVIFCLIILTLWLFCSNKFGYNKEIYFLFYGMVIGNILFPLWFFQGIEKLRISSILNVLTKFIFTILIFLIVKKSEQIYLVPIFYSTGYLVSGIVGFITARKMIGLNFYVPNIKIIKRYFYDSFSYFLSRVSVSAYSTANTFIIGLVLGPVIAGYFSAAEKLYNAILSIISVISDVLFPYMTRTKDLKVFKKITSVVLLISIVGLLFGLMFSNQVITLVYGEGYQGSVIILQLLLISTIFGIPSILIGYPLLASFGLERYTNYSVFLASIIHLTCLIIFIPFKNIYLFSGIIIITQLVVLVIRLMGVWKLRDRDRKTYNKLKKVNS